jgi:hypothetical protein
MTIEQAVSMLSKVKSVKEWNAVRENVKRNVLSASGGIKTWLKVYVPSIDGSGLITAILGKDLVKPKK